MTGLACLPMYDWPEERAAVDALWSTIRTRAGGDLPVRLTRPVNEAALFALWRDPRLVFAQTCRGPMALGLVPGLRVLAQPDYADVPGGRGPFYRSALVAREGASCAVPAGPGAALPKGIEALGRLALNARHSLSGWIALRDDLGTDPATLAGAIVETGSHRASIRAVAEGRADLAAVDCRSWALALRHEACAKGLVVVGWTAERLGLPYVTGPTTSADTAARLSRVLFGMGCHPPQEEFV